MSQFMLEYIKDYLINMLFILLPILFSQSIMSKEHIAFETKKQKVLLTIIFTGTSLLCMSYPFQLGGNTILDLRLIPFVIGMLYGGVRVGFVIMLISLVYRFILGGFGFYLSVAEYLIIFSLILIIIENYRYYSLVKKITVISCITVFPTVLFMPVAATMLSDELSIKIGTALVFVSIFSIWLSIYLMESTIEKVHMMIQLHKFEKESIVSHLAASVSHEVRNPLTVTKGFLQLLREKYKDTEDKEYFDLALSELRNAESIISDYLTYAKPSMEVRAPMNLYEELENATKIISSYAQLHNVNIKLTGESADYQGDKEKIRQLLINVMKNCVEAMPNGGVVTVSLQKTKSDIVITVKDTGVGMTEAQLLRLGEPFFSTKENGTGLGMMVAFSVIKSMGGRYEVQSKVNEGTSFYIYIPRRKNE